MQKRSWQVGLGYDNAGKRVHIYTWAYDAYRDRLLVSDKAKWHHELVPKTEPYKMGDPFRECRGLVMLYPETKIGYVLMYEGSGHQDAEFVPSNVWRSIESEFPDYELEERRGLKKSINDAVEGEEWVPTPTPMLQRKPMYASFKSKFLRKKP